jgi:hypothetical protein
MVISGFGNQPMLPERESTVRWSNTQSAALAESLAADYAGTCHRAAPCADPLGSNPIYTLAPIRERPHAKARDVVAGLS